MTRRLSSPRGLAALALPAIVLVVLPVVAIVWRTPWSGFWESISSDASRTAVWLSLRTSLVTTALALVFGTPLAWMLAHSRFRGRSLLRALCILPMVLPPVVGGVALLFAFGRRGLVGGPLYEVTGLSLPFTTAGTLVEPGTFSGLPTGSHATPQ